MKVFKQKTEQKKSNKNYQNQNKAMPPFKIYKTKQHFLLNYCLHFIIIFLYYRVKSNNFFFFKKYLPWLGN